VLNGMHFQALYATELSKDDDDNDDNNNNNNSNNNNMGCFQI
jgi:hypothetical protein